MNFADEFMPSAKTVYPRQTVRTEVNGTERNGTERNGTERQKRDEKRNGTERNKKRNGTERNGTERKRELFFDAYCILHIIWI